MHADTLLGLESGTAVISPCGRYRYLLTRRIESRPNAAMFIMLNPSTANATGSGARLSLIPAGGVRATASLATPLRRPVQTWTRCLSLGPPLGKNVGCLVVDELVIELRQQSAK